MGCAARLAGDCLLSHASPPIALTGPSVVPHRFKLDENLPRRVDPALRELGHDVETALSENLSGAADPAVLAGIRVAATERPVGQLWVIDKRRVRIREQRRDP